MSSGQASHTKQSKKLPFQERRPKPIHAPNPNSHPCFPTPTLTPTSQLRFLPPEGPGIRPKPLQPLTQSNAPPTLTTPHPPPSSPPSAPNPDSHTPLPSPTPTPASQPQLSPPPPNSDSSPRRSRYPTKTPSAPHPIKRSSTLTTPHPPFDPAYVGPVT
jgi:hypothetical protein